MSPLCQVHKLWWAPQPAATQGWFRENEQMNYRPKHFFTTGGWAFQVEKPHSVPSCAWPVGFADKCAADESQAAPPQPRLLPWVHVPALSCQIHCSDHPRWQEALGAAQHWTCQLGMLSKASRCKRQLNRLFIYFSDFELGTVGREAMQKTRGRFSFLLNCLKRQGYWNARRGMISRKREKSGCCFRSSFLVFTLIYSGNPPQASVAIWNEAAEGGIADGACCSLWGSPMQMVKGFHAEAGRLCIQVWVVTTFRFVLPGCSHF